jgi:hypothetical protein
MISKVSLAATPGSLTDDVAVHPWACQRIGVFVSIQVIPQERLSMHHSLIIMQTNAILQ